jgi:putative (di)nucleoside polyphosphate hydrolase
MSLSRNDDDYRPGVGIVLFHQNRRDVLVAKRLDMRYDAWQMPQGGIDPGEDPLETAFRELEEEVGTANASVIGESADWLYYDLPEGLQKQMWKGRYKGQRQKWFAMEFHGEDGEINLETEIPEFMDWKWTPLPTIVDLIVDFKVPLYQQILDEFAPLSK